MIEHSQRWCKLPRGNLTQVTSSRTCPHNRKIGNRVPLSLRGHRKCSSCSSGFLPPSRLRCLHVAVMCALELAAAGAAAAAVFVTALWYTPWGHRVRVSFSLGPLGLRHSPSGRRRKHAVMDISCFETSDAWAASLNRSARRSMAQVSAHDLPRQCYVFGQRQ